MEILPGHLRSTKSNLYKLLLERKRRLARKNLYYFCKYILGFKDMALQPHWEVCRFAENYCHWTDTLVLLPRGTFKSSILSVGYPMWRWLRDRNLRFLSSSYVHDNTKGFLGLISNHLQFNGDFIELFGDWAEDSTRWTKERLSISGRSKFRAEESLTASSLGISKVSQHYDHALLDDLQTDKNLSSKEMINAIISYLQLLNPILDPMPGSDSPGPKTIIGTRWHFDDAYGRLRAIEVDSRKRGNPPRLRMLIREAIDKSGKSVFFPSRFTAKYLEDLRRSGMSEYHFSCQYLNNPIPDGSSIFKLSHLGWFWMDEHGYGKLIAPRFMNPTQRVEELPPILNTFSICDPSLGEKSGSDYTAIDTVGVDYIPRIFILEILRKHLRGNDAIIAELFRVRDKWKPLRFGIETSAYQKSLQIGFEAKARDSGDWFFIEQLKTDNRTSKEWRIRGFEPFVTRGSVYVRVRENTDLTQEYEALYHAAVEGVSDLLDEMIRFPVGATDDTLDALAYAPQLIYPTGQEESPPAPPGSFERMLGHLFQKNKARLTIRPR